MPINKTLSSGNHPVKIWTDEVEASAMVQLENLSNVPFIHKHVAVMPDVHWGMGSTIGSVIPTKKAIIPAAVGVDIGCGMIAQKLDLTADDLPDNLEGVRSAIEIAVPHGRTSNGGPADRGAWGDTPTHIAASWIVLATTFNRIVEKHPKVGKQVNNHRHLGTLGTGNHFIEVCLDENNDVWVMLHSGSRGVGNRIGSYFIKLAKEDMKKWFINVPDVDLAYFPEGTEHFDDYWMAVAWAQEYARLSRELMISATIPAMSAALGRPLTATLDAVNCHHNYVAIENHYGENVYVTRKGALRARKGDMGIIPGSMGARSYIVRGLGNQESFNSCSHGAGRVMSRGTARKKFTQDDLIAQTAGVECRKDADVIDEIPGAYKNIDEVMAHQNDLVEPLYTLKQVICVKG